MINELVQDVYINLFGENSKKLVQQEEEQKSQDEGKPKINLFFPQKEY